MLPLALTPSPCLTCPLFLLITLAHRLPPIYPHRLPPHLPSAQGETHYIVLTIKKATLLSHGVLREDLSGAALLTKVSEASILLVGSAGCHCRCCCSLLLLAAAARCRCSLPLLAAAARFSRRLHPTYVSQENLDEAALMKLSRSVANIIGLPESTAFTSFHPAKLFDFSTRARCLAPFRILATKGGGATKGEVVGLDLEAQPFLKDSVRCHHHCHERHHSRSYNRHPPLPSISADLKMSFQICMRASELPPSRSAPYIYRRRPNGTTERSLRRRPRWPSGTRRRVPCACIETSDLACLACWHAAM